MRSNGLTAADWQVIAEYITLLKPLKLATKRLEGRGKSGRYGAIDEVIPVFEYLLNTYENIASTYESVDYEAQGASEYHLAINVCAGIYKLADYFSKLDESPYYFIATILHPYYKTYCKNAWRDKDDWLDMGYAGFQRIWRKYKPQQQPLRRPKATNSSIDESIDDVVNAESSSGGHGDLDEYEKWRMYEPRWTREHYDSDNSKSAVEYWLRMKPLYPN